MNLYTELEDHLKTACGAVDVALAAGVPQTTWQLAHVFMSGRGYIKGQNRGRVPFVSVWRENSEYSFDAVGVGEQGGLVTSSWNIEVVVGAASRANESANEMVATLIAQKIIKNVRADSNLCIGEEKIGAILCHPFGLSLMVQLTIQNTNSTSNN